MNRIPDLPEWLPAAACFSMIAVGALVLLFTGSGT